MQAHDKNSREPLQNKGEWYTGCLLTGWLLRLAERKWAWPRGCSPSLLSSVY